MNVFEEPNKRFLNSIVEVMGVVKISVAQVRQIRQKKLIELLLTLSVVLYASLNEAV